MATSGSLSTGSYEGRYLKLSWTQTKDIANNKSTISWTLSSVGGSATYYSTGPTTVKINGTQVYYKEWLSWSSKTFPAAKGSASGTTTINHASDGTGSIKVEISTAIYVESVSTVSNTWTLDSIPRASTPTLSASSVNMGSSIVISTNRASTSFTHAIRYKWNGTTTNLTSGVGASYTWTVPTSFANALPTATSGTVTVYLDTYSGTTLVGTKSVTFTAKVPNADWSKPKINSVTTAPSGNLDWVGSIYVQSKTKVRVTTNAECQAGATSLSYTVDVNSKRYVGSDITSEVLSNSGSLPVLVTVTDSRGYTNSKTVFISVEAYKQPYIANHSTQNKIIYSRCDSNGNIISNGTNLKLLFSKKWTQLSNKSNKALVQYQINSLGWVDASAYTSGDSGSLDVSLTIKNIVFELKQSYTLYIKITDKFGESDTFVFYVPTEEIVFHLREGGKGAAFGGYATEAETVKIDNDWNLRYKGQILVDFVIENGTSGVWTYRKWYSGKAECWCTYASTVNSNAWTAWGSSYYAPVLAEKAIYFPFTFTSVPQVYKELGNVSGSMLLINGWNSTTTTTYMGAVYGLRPVAPTSACYADLYLYVIGNWK